MWVGVLSLSPLFSVLLCLLLCLYPTYFYAHFADQTNRMSSDSILLMKQADDWLIIRGIYIQAVIALIFGHIIRIHNDEMLARMAKLRDEAVIANNTKLTFIAKMR
jgi:hypothetical protein